ncbi:hypothetical protein G6F58_010706 [Rhizopus delemar]|nr:hypothetical protein G6F58_010706 [Rhizopus delemar]
MNKEVEGAESHRDHAFHLVEGVTDQRRRPSKGGVLSNLLKLDVFDNNQSRPSHQLKSITSSRAFLQMMSAPSSARNSLMADDRAELGLADVAAHRIAIASEIADILSRQDVVIKLGKALVKTGAPSHRIEAAMEKVSRRLEIVGNYAVLPGLIIVTFGDLETHTSETHLIRCARSLDIGKLEKANYIASRMAKGELDIHQATALLDDIIHGPPTWRPLSILLAYVLSSAFTAPLFFHGSWIDCGVSAIFGLCVGVLTLMSEKIPMFSNIFEMAITIPIAIIALALHPYICFAAVAMASIVIALPGYSLTCAVMELSAKNLVSGSIHLVYALMYVLFLAFGIGYGCSVWRLAHPDVELNVLGACQNGLDPYWTFLFLPLATIGLGTVYGADAYQWPSMVLDSAVGYTVYYFVGKYTGNSPVITPSAGAFALGLFGNLYARITKRLAFAPLMGGTIILVPGSIGVRGAVSLFDGSNDSSGSSFVFQVLGIALSLTLGLFLANLVVYPNGKKRSVFLGF